jgi:hypothetical protein
MTLVSKSIVTLSLATFVAVSLTSLAAAQGGPAMPGPTGAPKVAPPIVMPPRTPPIGGPVVLEPPVVTPPKVPKGAREPLQGQVVREVGSRSRFTGPCPSANSAAIKPFSAISGSIQAQTKPPIAPSYGADILFSAACFGEAPGSLSIYIAPTITQLGQDNRSVASIQTPVFWSNNFVRFFVPSVPYSTLEFAAPAVIVFDIYRPTGTDSYRAILSRDAFMALQRGQAATNPPASN